MRLREEIAQAATSYNYFCKGIHTILIFERKIIINYFAPLAALAF